MEAMQIPSRTDKNNVGAFLEVLLLSVEVGLWVGPSPAPPSFGKDLQLSNFNSRILLWELQKDQNQLCYYSVHRNINNIYNGLSIIWPIHNEGEGGVRRT